MVGGDNYIGDQNTDPGYFLRNPVARDYGIGSSIHYADARRIGINDNDTGRGSRRIDAVIADRSPDIRYIDPILSVLHLIASDGRQQKWRRVHLVRSPTGENAIEISPNHAVFYLHHAAAQIRRILQPDSSATTNICGHIVQSSRRAIPEVKAD